jgi:hypothetical protein
VMTERFLEWDGNGKRKTSSTVIRSRNADVRR